MDYDIKQKIVIAPQSGIAFKLKDREKLRVIDQEGQQVADLLAFKLNNPREYLSTGATIDSNSSLSIGLKVYLYSESIRG